MAKEIRYEFTVEGRGPFPIDMLRYDRCWPKAEIPDSGNIYQTFALRATRNEAFKITLVGLKEPTEGRWKSFGWSVVTSRKITLV